ncbi:MAG: hypothetical protein ACKO15_13800, partial [Burkholderiales bacterium]
VRLAQVGWSPEWRRKRIKKQMFKFLSDTVLQGCAWRRGVTFVKALLSPKIVLWVESHEWV